MATTISSTDYLSLATAYGNASTRSSYVKQDLYDAAYIVVLLSTFEPTIDLFNVFYDSYKINSYKYDNNTILLPPVRALNNHIISRGGYATIDAYLAANSLLVPCTWAKLCQQAGYTISSAYIDPATSPC